MRHAAVRYLALAVVGLAAAGCVDVVESSPHAVWVKKPLIAFGTIEGTAASECEKYGKHAVFQGALEDRYSPAVKTAGSETRSVFVPIYAFDCE